MRIRVFGVVMLLIAGVYGGGSAQAAPIVLVAGPLQAPGGFSQEGMHPVFTSCSLPSFSSPTATTNVLFVIRKSTHDAYFQISNRCGTYDEVFDFTECEHFPDGDWSCEHTRSDGGYALATFAMINGVPHADAIEYSPDRSRFWEVNGYVLVSAE